MTTQKTLISALMVIALSACSDSSDYDFDASREAAEEAAAQLPSSTFEAQFDPANQVIPFPNNLLLAGSEDGTLNIGVDDANNYADPQVALNALDGFSTTAPITATFSQALDAESLIIGETVRVFEVTTTAEGATTGIVGELGAADLALAIPAENPQTLAILPLRPLKESTSYLVVLTNSINNTEGSVPDKSVSYHLVSGDTELTGATAALEPVRLLTSSFEAVASAAGVAEANIVLSWAFTTQSITPVMDALAAKAEASAITIIPTATPSSTLNPALTGDANVYVGAITVPYYQTAPTTEDPNAAINGFMIAENGGFLTRFNPSPAAQSNQTIPVLFSAPAAGEAPASGWPVVIFQHGITQERSNMLALADGMARAGLAVIAIDMPMHGIVDTSNPLNAANPLLAPLGATERTFGLDLQDNSTMAAGPDGTPDTSGTHFYNLGNLLNARDNLRQAVSDLLVLRNSLSSIDVVPINSAQVGFVGHSLGGIVGTPFLALDTVVGPASLAMPGGGIAQMLANSASFGPVINAGLESQGAAPGSDEYARFLTAAQTVVDSGDPINFAVTAAAAHPIHLMEVVGGSGGSLPDQVIPNAVATAPLSGTEPMIRVMALPPVVETTGTGAAPVSGAVRFVAGGHASLLSPTDDALTTVEMQTQVATFMASQGTQIPITNPSVIAGAQ
ncbi:MAG TPA: lipase [Gammaproteobacteria bacterium]|nr:lipase [Gammaproteobacteria bacterium]